MLNVHVQTLKVVLWNIWTICIFFPKQDMFVFVPLSFVNISQMCFMKKKKLWLYQANFSPNFKLYFCLTVLYFLPEVFYEKSDLMFPSEPRLYFRLEPDWKEKLSSSGDKLRGNVDFQDLNGNLKSKSLRKRNVRTACYQITAYGS